MTEVPVVPSDISSNAPNSPIMKSEIIYTLSALKNRKVPKEDNMRKYSN